MIKNWIFTHYWIPKLYVSLQTALYLVLLGQLNTQWTPAPFQIINIYYRYVNLMSKTWVQSYCDTSYTKVWFELDVDSEKFNRSV